jgi:hypothetical protein
MGAKVQRLRLRLFIEGVEVPVIAAQVQVSPNSPMVAAIQIPPLAEATRFHPRSLIHLFFLDFYEIENPNIRLSGASGLKAPGPTAYQQSLRSTEPIEVDGEDPTIEITNEFVRDANNNKYKLLFAGELMGFQWTKNAVNRSVVLQCSDFSNYWDYAYQFNNTDIFGPGIKAMFTGGSTNLFTDFLSSPGEIVTKIIMTPSTRYPGLKGLLGGVIHLLEAMGGSYYYDKKYAGQNVFFSLAELRLRLSQMITAFDKDPTSHKLLGGSFDALFGRSIGNLGDQASFRKVVNQLISVIFHECYPQPCPLYVPGLEGTISGFVRKKLDEIPEFAGLGAVARTVANNLNTMQTEIGVFSDGETGTQSAAHFRDDLVSRLGRLLRVCKDSAQDVLRSATGKPQLKSLADRTAAVFNVAATNIGLALSILKRSVSPSAFSQAFGKLDSARAQLDKVASFEANTTPPKQAIPAALKQQIFRPDVWFSAPPRCNVLFPDQYTTLSYSRQFMAEPTRLMLKTNDEFFGEDILFDHFYFAPKAITLKQEQNTLQAMLKNDLLDHEIFTGILPVFEKMGEFNIFAARSGMVDGKTPKIGLAQRSTNFLYFKYRFAPRQLQLTGRFNPYIACGFPGLVIDKYVDLQTFKLHNELLKSLPDADSFPTRELNKMLGTHFLCNFTEVTHQIDQGGGVTLINGSYARQAEESVEFLGAVQEEVIMKKQDGPPATRTDRWAAITPPRVGSQGPNLGRIVKVEEVRGGRSSSLEDGLRLPLFNGKRDKRTKQVITQVPVGINALARNYGPDIVELVGDENLPVTFRAFDVTEEIPRTKRQTVELPPEEYIRPGWYGDCWHPAKISEVYYNFFATGAITETAAVQNLGGENLDGLTSSDASSTLADLVNQDNPIALARDQLIQLSLTKDANIEQAVAFLVLTYSVIKQAGFDPEQFIRSYTWRPIATLLDMFGTSDLLLSPDGKEVVQGVEGFHSRAFGPYEDLFGLVTEDIESVVGIRRGSTQAKKADKRKAKYERVLDYVAALRLSRAILG